MKKKIGKIIATLLVAGVVLTSAVSVVTTQVAAAENTWSEEDMKIMYFSMALKENIYSDWIKCVDYSEMHSMKDFVLDLDAAKEAGATQEQIDAVIDKWLVYNIKYLGYCGMRESKSVVINHSEACYAGTYEKLIKKWIEFNGADKICWGHINNFGNLKAWVDIIGPTNVPYEQAKICGYENEWIAAHATVSSMTCGDAMLLDKTKEWAEAVKWYNMTEIDAINCGIYDFWKEMIDKNQSGEFTNLYDAQENGNVDEFLKVKEGFISKVAYGNLYRNSLLVKRDYSNGIEYIYPSMENIIKLYDVWATNATDAQVKKVNPEMILPEFKAVIDRFIKVNGYKGLTWQAAVNLNLQKEYVQAKGIANVKYYEAKESGYEKEWIDMHKDVTSMTSGDALMLDKLGEYNTVKETSVSDIAAVVEAADEKIKTVKVDAVIDYIHLDKEIFTKASEKKLAIVIEKKDAVWKFDDLSNIENEAFGDGTSKFNAEVSVLDFCSADPFEEKPETKYVSVNFAHEGKLPAPAEVTISTKDKFKDNADIYFYLIRMENSKVLYEQLGKVKANYGQVKIKIDHCSSYILSETPISNDKIYKDKAETGWNTEDGVAYWYEDGVKQGVKLNEDGSIDLSYRGKEIYDPESNAWYWLDNVLGGAVAKSKDVYQESDAGIWSTKPDGTGKWVRYDANGLMIKGWCAGTGVDAKTISSSKDGNGQDVYYFDKVFGTMAKGYATIDGKEYYFDINSGVLDVNYEPIDVKKEGWMTIGGKDVWYEDYNRQGYKASDAAYRGKEIFDKESEAWYWLDNVQGGAKAVSKDVYQESLAGDWGVDTDESGNKIGKWVRYDKDGHMIKGWCAGTGADAVAIANQNEGNGAPVYYFDMTYGTMAKGIVTIDGNEYSFDEVSGVFKDVIDKAY